MKTYTIKISKSPETSSEGPYFITPSIYDGVGTRQLETREDLTQALHRLTGTTDAGVANTLKQIEEKGHIIVQQNLTEESAKSFGWNY